MDSSAPYFCLPARLHLGMTLNGFPRLPLSAQISLLTFISSITQAQKSESLSFLSLASHLQPSNIVFLLLHICNTYFFLSLPATSLDQYENPPCLRSLPSSGRCPPPLHEFPRVQLWQPHLPAQRASMALHCLLHGIWILSPTVQGLLTLTWSSLPNQFLTSPLNVIQVIADLVSGFSVLSCASAVARPFSSHKCSGTDLFNDNWIPTPSTLNVTFLVPLFKYFIFPLNVPEHQVILHILSSPCYACTGLFLKIVYLLWGQRFYLLIHCYTFCNSAQSAALNLMPIK